MNSIKISVIRHAISIISIMFFICLAVVYEYSNYISNDFLSVTMVLGAENTVLPPSISPHSENNPKSKNNKVKEAINNNLATLFTNHKSQSSYSANSASFLLCSLYSNVRGCFHRFCQLDDIPPPYFLFFPI